MSVKNPLYRFVNGILFKKTPSDVRGTNVGSLEEALEGIAKCGCGVRCCEGSEALLLKAQDDGTIYEIYITGGNLVIKNASDDSTETIVVAPVAS